MLWQRLGISEEQQSVKAVRKSPRWRKLESPIKSFMGNSLHLMSNSCPPELVLLIFEIAAHCQLRIYLGDYSWLQRVTKLILKM